MRYSGAELAAFTSGFDLACEIAARRLEDLPTSTSRQALVDGVRALKGDAVELDLERGIGEDVQPVP
jgi:hypothetical protein